MKIVNSQQMIYKTLWIVTGLVAASLMILTIWLAINTSKAKAAGFYTSIESVNPTVSIREDPSWAGPIVAILENETRIFVDDETVVGVTEWFHITSGNISGWVPARYTSLHSP